jgi:hypothetical protein
MTGWSIVLAVVAVVLRESISPFAVIGIGSLVIWAAGAYGMFEARGSTGRLLAYECSPGAFVTRWPIIAAVAAVGYWVLRWTGHTLHLI